MRPRSRIIILSAALSPLACEGGGADGGSSGSTGAASSSSETTANASGSTSAAGSSSGSEGSSSGGVTSSTSAASSSSGADGSTSTGADGLHPAYAEFDPDNFTIMRDGDEVVIQSNGLPNHVSPYWSNTTARSAIDPMGNTIDTPAAEEDHPLFVPPTATSFESMAPGNIDDFMGMYELRVPVAPSLAGSSTATGLGPIGMAVSGSMIYNDEEGPNVPLDDAVPSLDFTAAHTGPQSYHYHLEPHAWSEDDDALIGIMSDGFFLYGRREPDGTYPNDLDVSGGHVGATPHAESEYHYHVQNDAYLGAYYLLFPGDFQGTPTGIQ